MIHGTPRPRNTFTELLPVTLPMAAIAHLDIYISSHHTQSGCLVEIVIPLSAVFSVVAAILLAKVSGREVPRATKVIAVI